MQLENLTVDIERLGVFCMKDSGQFEITDTGEGDCVFSLMRDH